MRKIKAAVFPQFDFVCPICLCQFVAEGPWDFSRHSDEGEVFLMANCPECKCYGAGVKLSAKEQAIYLPYVDKYRETGGGDIELIGYTDFFVPFQAKCQGCHAEMWVKNSKPVKVGHLGSGMDNYGKEYAYVKCPACGDIALGIGEIDLESLKRVLKRK